MEWEPAVQFNMKVAPNRLKYVSVFVFSADYTLRSLSEANDTLSGCCWEEELMPGVGLRRSGLITGARGRL